METHIPYNVYPLSMAENTISKIKCANNAGVSKT